jgi:hypothetical protein
MRDVENCGSCGSRCETGENCYDGVCIAACPGGFTDCSGTCRDLDSDRFNCGACETECADGEVCESGACTVTCEPPLVNCSGVCTNTSMDPENCSACGAACGTQEACVSGTCMRVDTTCGDHVVQSYEEYDPPPGPFTSVSVDPTTCLWDFSTVSQLYCNGTCTWAGGSGCDSADADLFCKLKTGNPLSTNTSFTTTTALAEPGFPCPDRTTLGTSIGPLPLRGVTREVWYTDDLLSSTHGSGIVVTAVTCTDP